MFPMFPGIDDNYDGKRRKRGGKEKNFHDIALILLKKDIVFSPDVVPICLPKRRQVASANSDKD